MKLSVLIALALLILPIAVHSQPPQLTYAGIYADESQTTWCASGTPPYTIDMWIYALIGQNGIKFFTFDLDIPSNVEVAWIDVRTSDTPTMCKPPYCPNGIHCSFEPCVAPPRFLTTWLVHATLNVLDANPSVVRIIPNPDINEIRVTTCGDEHETPRIWTQLYVNYAGSSPECGTLPVEAVTWGMVKSMYD